jgi:hypothetical protein
MRKKHFFLCWRFFTRCQKFQSRLSDFSSPRRMVLSGIPHILSCHKIVFTRCQKFSSRRQGVFSQQKSPPKRYFRAPPVSLEAVKPCPGAGFQRNGGSQTGKRGEGAAQGSDKAPEAALAALR